MNKHLSAWLTILILVPLILAACGGDDGEPEEQACIDPANPDNVLQSYTLDMEASFDSDVSYNFPAVWSLNEVSDTVHELRIPQVPPVIFRIVDTGELRSLGLPESVSTEVADFNRYAEAYYEGYDRVGFSTGTALGQPYAEGQFTLPCEGAAIVRLFNNAEGKIMAIDLRSESGPIPGAFQTVRSQLMSMLAGQ